MGLVSWLVDGRGTGRGTNDPDACLGDYGGTWGRGVSGCIMKWRLEVGRFEGVVYVPRTKLNWMYWPSCWLASPLLPSRGSSSALLWLTAGFSSGIPVAEDIVKKRVQGNDFE